MRYIAYLKEECCKPVELFVWKGKFNTKEQYIAYKDSSNWKKADMIAPFLGVYDCDDIKQLREHISIDTGFVKQLIQFRKVCPGLMNLTIDSQFLHAWELQTGMHKILDGFVICDFEFGPIRAAAEMFNCDESVFELIVTSNSAAQLPEAKNRPQKMVL